MTIALVQPAVTSNGNPPLSFGSPVSAGSTVIVEISAYTSTGGSPQVTAMKLGSSAPLGTAAFWNPGTTGGLLSPFNGSNAAFLSQWMLPDCPAGSTAIDFTLSGASGILGTTIYEFGGMPAAPVVDVSSNGSNATTTAVDSGSAGPTTGNPELIIGGSTIFGGGTAPSGWTTQNPSLDSWAGFQIATSSGGSFDWTQTGAGGNPWVAAVVAIPGSSSVVNVTADLAVQLGPLALAAAAAEKVSARLAAGLGPLALAAGGTETGQDITAVLGVQLAPLVFSARQRGGAGPAGAGGASDGRSSFKKRLIWE